MHSLNGVEDSDTSENTQADYTRVTQVLSPFSGIDKINPDVVANAGRRGKQVHDICEGIVKGMGVWETSEELKPYIDSFMQWWSLGHEVIAVEKRFFCDELMITGQVDYIINTSHGSVIVDLKTSYKPSKTWPLQGSAYSYLAKKNGYDIEQILFLHLNKLGGPPNLIYYEEDFDLYLKCLDVYNYFYKKKTKTKR